MTIFNLIIVAHFLEHIMQMVQLYIMHLPRSQCLGLLGSLCPPLMHSEWLHYGHALFMFGGLYILRMRFRGFWSNFALGFSYYHLIEHTILLSQALEGVPMPLRASLGSFLMPRLELHFLYNLIALGLMIMAFRQKNSIRLY